MVSKDTIRGVFIMKQKGKRVLAVALSALLSLSTLPSVAFASNTPSAWAQSQVNEAISYGLVPDSIRGDYQSPITRIEFAELIVELALDYYAKPDLYGAMGVEPREENMGQYMFQDVAQEDHYVARLAYGLRFMDGIGDHLFGPDQLLTREQAATIMANAAKQMGKTISNPGTTFADSGSISSWAKDGVGQIVSIGVMSGMGNNLFAPKESITREQSIIMALKFYQYLKNGAVYTPQSGTAQGSQTGSTTGSQTTTPATGGSFQASFDAIHDGLSYQLDLMEISNATDGKNWPSSDNFPKVDGSLYNLYPDQNVALGYLEAARSEMISAGAVAIEIEINGMMGYTQSSLYRKNQEARERISGHIETARGYLEKAQNAVK